MNGAAPEPELPDPRVAHWFLDDAAAHTPHAPAVRDETGFWTYRELRDASRHAAAWLRRRGVGHGDRLIVALPNSRLFLAVMYGAMRSGIITVPMSTQARPYHFEAVLRDCTPRLILTDGSLQLPNNVTIASNARLASPDEVLAESGSVEPAADTADPSDIALLVYTSGSAARPKGVVSRHHRVTFAARAIAGRLCYRPDDIVCCRLPLSFDYSLYQAFLCADASAELVMVGAQDELSIYRTMRDSGATVLPLVPPAALTLLRLAGRDGVLRPRLITNTGGELTASIAARLRKTFPGVALVPMYGMTECKRITVAGPDEDLVKPGSVGAAIPGTLVEVVGPDGQLLPSGEIGEVIVRGEHVMDGYWADPETSAQWFPVDPRTGERYLRTGDYAYLDQDGALTFVGRRDDIFKRNGQRTSINEIEAAALDIPQVLEAAAALVGPERECVLWARASARPDEITREIAHRLGSAKVPDRCFVMPALPRTTSGKIDKVLLRASLAVAR